jgi:hypothetical protein
MRDDEQDKVESISISGPLKDKARPTGINTLKVSAAVKSIDLDQRALLLINR